MSLGSSSANILAPQTLISAISYSVLCIAIMVPFSISYSEFDMSKRAKMLAMVMLYGLLISYTVNCAATGNCIGWSWILAMMVVIIPNIVLTLVMIFPKKFGNVWIPLEDITN